jgi:hypothetical protein
MKKKKMRGGGGCDWLGEGGEGEGWRGVTCFACGLHANHDVGHVVEGVKDAEHVHTVLDRFLTKPEPQQKQHHSIASKPFKCCAWGTDRKHSEANLSVN